MSGGWWFRLDGEFAENTKVMELSDRAFRLHVAGLCHTTRNLTDGFLSERAVKVVCALTAAARKHLVELRDSGLWIARDDGYEIKDYLLYNPPAEKVKELRDARKAAGHKGGLASGAKRRAAQQAKEANASASAVASGTPDRSNHGTERNIRPKAVSADAPDEAASDANEQPQVIEFKIPDLELREMPAA